VFWGIFDVSPKCGPKHLNANNKKPYIGFLMSDENSQRSYKRNQVEWALWGLFAQQPAAESDDIPSVFRTRIKRLIELDQNTNEKGMPKQLAFVETKVHGQGKDQPYTLFNTFCLALGLDLLDAGFKQSEIVFLLRHHGPTIRSSFNAVLASPPILRSRLLAEQRPKSPKIDEGALEFADTRVFFHYERVEVREAFVDFRGKNAPKHPLIINPKVFLGLAALTEELDQMNMSYRKALILEVSETIIRLQQLLGEAPLTVRGRGITTT